jgi:hypothetical protein
LLSSGQGAKSEQLVFGKTGLNSKPACRYLWEAKNAVVGAGDGRHRAASKIVEAL